VRVRRPNGSSSIFLGSDGRWHGWVTMGSSSGAVRNRRHVSGSTRGAVAAKVRDLEHEREARDAIAEPSMTLSTWLEHWLANVAAVRVRPRTLERYQSIVRRHIMPSIGSRPIDAVRAAGPRTALRRPAHKRPICNLSPTGARVLSRATKVALQREHVQRDVTRLVDPPAQRRSTIARPLTLEEARRVLIAARDQRNAARWSVALALGMRQSEALALRWVDVDLDREHLTVRRTVHRVKGRAWCTRSPSRAQPTIHCATE
jgi:integrase